jgi:sulfur relay (sulfurtransferase) DsrC/TusE family protein
MSELTTTWGRVDQSGTVFVQLDGEWVSVGAFPDATPEEALALYEKKHAELEGQIALAEQRLKAGANAKDISRSVEKLQAELATPHTVGDIASLRARVNSVMDALAPLMEQQKAEREKAVTEAVSHREALVTAIEALAAQPAEQVRWKEATQKVSELFTSWQEHQQNGPRLPKATADELWKRFRAARNTLDRGRRQHFQERDKLNKEAKSVKRDLIDKAEALATKGASGISEYRALLEQWKKAPRASRSVDDALWQKFKAAGDALYQAKTSEDEAADEANRENGEKKQALLDKYAHITNTSDHEQASTLLRAFHDEFKKIGPVPKALVKTLDQKVKAFDAHVKALLDKHWKDNDPEKKARSMSFLEQLTDQIDSLEKAIAEATSAGDSTRVKDLTDERDAKIAWRQALDS